MRMFPLAAIIVLAAFAAPGALACHYTGVMDPPPPLPSPSFWSEAPPASALEPGEVVLKAAFRRFGMERDSMTIDPARLERPGLDVVIITCGGFYPVYNVIDVLAGQYPQESTLQVHGLVGLASPASSDELILVGRLFPLTAANANGPPPASDSPRYMIMMRPPPEAPLNAPHK